jgi:hypothetical protein
MSSGWGGSHSTFHHLEVAQSDGLGGADHDDAVTVMIWEEGVTWVYA